MLSAVIKSVSSVLLYVADPERSSRFYRDLGFKAAGSDRAVREVRLNWFRLQFVDKASVEEPHLRSEARVERKGAGAFIGISVENFDKFCKALRSRGVTFIGEPSQSSRGNRQVAVNYPDGYNLMLYEAKK